MNSLEPPRNLSPKPPLLLEDHNGISIALIIVSGQTLYLKALKIYNNSSFSILSSECSSLGEDWELGRRLPWKLAITLQGLCSTEYSLLLNQRTLSKVTLCLKLEEEQWFFIAPASWHFIFSYVIQETVYFSFCMNSKNTISVSDHCRFLYIMVFWLSLSGLVVKCSNNHWIPHIAIPTNSLALGSPVSWQSLPLGNSGLQRTAHHWVLIAASAPLTRAFVMSQ